MKILALDSSIIFTILKGEPGAGVWVRYLQQQSGNLRFVISSAALAEVRGFCVSDDDCRRRLEQLGITYSALNEAACLLAGQLYQAYRRAGGPRVRILPDFLIAGHAAVQADILATTDQGFTRTYFPKLKTITTEEIQTL